MSNKKVSTMPELQKIIFSLPLEERIAFLCKTCKEKYENNLFKQECSKCFVKRDQFEDQLNRELNPEYYSQNYKVCAMCEQNKNLHHFHNKYNICKECRSTKESLQRKENIYQFMWKEARSRAAKFNREFTITPEDIEAIWVSHCPIFGIPLIINTNTAGPNSPSLDRIDNTKGYTPDNIAVVSFKFNSMKRDLTPEILRTMLKYMEGRLF